MKHLVAVLVGLGLCAAQPALAQEQKKPVEKPVDNGPATPGANNAYQGGGVVLQGAPGAPPPKVEPTPAGQAPAHSVPPGKPASP